MAIGVEYTVFATLLLISIGGFRCEEFDHGISSPITGNAAPQLSSSNSESSPHAGADAELLTQQSEDGASQTSRSSSTTDAVFSTESSGNTVLANSADASVDAASSVVELAANSINSTDGDSKVEPLAPSGPDNEKLPESSSSASMAACFAPDTRYVPIDMVGQEPSIEASINLCQARCASVVGCAHFSYCENGSCHLQDVYASVSTDAGVTTGPPACATSESSSNWDSEPVRDDVGTGNAVTPSTAMADDVAVDSHTEKSRSESSAAEIIGGSEEAARKSSSLSRPPRTRESRWPLLWRRQRRAHPVCDAVCPRPDFSTFFGGVNAKNSRAFCPWPQTEEVVANLTEEAPSLRKWASKTLKEFFGIAPSSEQPAANESSTGSQANATNTTSTSSTTFADGVPFAGAHGNATHSKASTLMRLLCDLSDAGVNEDDSVVAGDCTKAILPAEYVEVCGRWQCKDPIIDRCFFTNRSAARRVQTRASSPKSLLSLKERRMCGRVEPFFQCDAHHGSWWSEVWRKVGIPLLEKLGDGSAAIDSVDVDDASTTEVRQSIPSSSAGNDSSNLAAAGASPASAPSSPNSTEAAELESANVAGVRWRRCADEGDLCLCVGDVRFGVEGNWSAEVLSVRHGFIGCSASLFASAEGMPVFGPGGARPGCECLSDDQQHKPLVVPSSATLPVKPSVGLVTRSPAERFIKSIPYNDSFLNGLKFDYASLSAGARIVTSAKSIQRASAVLSHDKDGYMLASCEDRPWFVISLLDHLFLEHVGLIALEHLASGFRHLQILGSEKYPTDKWRLLGEIETNPTATHQLFDVGPKCRLQKDSCWVRFVKVRTLSHHHLEANSKCTLTRFQVFGLTETGFLKTQQEEQDEVDRRVEPNLAAVAIWHDIAVFAALAGPHVANFGGSALRTNSPGASGAGQEGEQTLENGTAGNTTAELESSGALALRPRLPRHLYEGMLAMVRSKLSSALGSSDAGATNADENPAAAIVSEAPHVRPLKDLLVDIALNLTPEDKDRRNAPDWQSSLSALHTLMHPTSRSASAFISGLSPGLTPAIPQIAKPTKTSSSTPQLVRMHQELRVVQDTQAIHQESLRSLESEVRIGLELIFDAYVEQNQRLKELERRIDPNSRMSEDSWWSYVDGFVKHHGLVSISCAIVLSLPLWMLLLSWQASLRASSQEPVPHSPPALPDIPRQQEETQGVANYSELSAFTVSGLEGEAMAREVRDMLLPAQRGNQRQLAHMHQIALPPTVATALERPRRSSVPSNRRVNTMRPPPLNLSDSHGFQVSASSEEHGAVQVVSSASDGGSKDAPLLKLFRAPASSDDESTAIRREWPRGEEAASSRQPLSPSRPPESPLFAPGSPTAAGFQTPPWQPADRRRAHTRISTAASRHVVERKGRRRDVARHDSGSPYSP